MDFMIKEHILERNSAVQSMGQIFTLILYFPPRHWWEIHARKRRSIMWLLEFLNLRTLIYLSSLNNEDKYNCIGHINHLINTCPIPPKFLISDTIARMSLSLTFSHLPLWTFEIGPQPHIEAASFSLPDQLWWQSVLQLLCGLHQPLWQVHTVASWAEGGRKDSATSGRWLLLNEPAG